VVDSGNRRPGGGGNLNSGSPARNSGGTITLLLARAFDSGSGLGYWKAKNRAFSLYIPVHKKQTNNC